ncbi:tail fiber protein [Pseudomonas sp. 21LCFQ02]|uniref:phage tail protein n=1 Tax=unclassified Pseudomonas TaxID=196821 RepID=UPI0020984235|nr:MULTISPECIES: tail fiber protein [unclassified Pseudomonas]MCO8163558.1 tail fiber protein [Pseudomonas sp. 21LCFQ010]MCO8169974.1 tail fiber protein [Pseudomonas sp. 21LCFQ02]MCQ9426501.1 tail fiber protein [Pseudomonas sp. LJDD11]
MDVFVGSIYMWAGIRIPTGWHLCDGTTLKIQDYQILYSLIGTIYGGDGVTTFGLPNLVDRFPVGSATPPDASQLQKGSAAQATVLKTTAVLAANNLPEHTHPATMSLANLSGSTSISLGTGTTGGVPLASANAVLTGTSNNPGAAAIYQAAPPASGSTVTLGGVKTEISDVPKVTVGNNVGGAPILIEKPVSNRPPSVAINYIICLEGLYPSRP